MKRPFDSVREIFSDNLVRGREDFKATIEQAHSFMSWIVGFAIGGLYLIVSNFDKADKICGHDLVKSILILLTISIVSGISYRLAINVYQTKMRSAMFYVEGAFSDKDMMPAHPADISTLTDVREMKILLEQYGEDVTSVVEQYAHASQQDKIKIWDELKQRYVAIAEWAERDHQIAIEDAKNIYQKAYGLSKTELDKQFNEYSSEALKIWRYISAGTFYLSCGSFVIVPILICIKY